MTRILAVALSLFITASAALISTVAGVEAKTLGIVALIANDALNVAVIAGATDAAKAAGWDVKVVDTQASADQANAGMSSFAVQKVDAIMVLAFASSSIGSGLAAANAAGIPVASWGGEIVPGIIVTTSGQTVGEDSAKYLLGKVGDNADVLAMTFHPGKLCIDRGDAFDAAVKGKAGLNITYNEVTVPGQVQNGNAIAQPWLTAHPAGGKKPLAIWACWDEPMQGAVAALRQAARGRRHDCRHQWQPAGDPARQGRRHDRNRLAARLSGGQGHVPGDPQLDRGREILGAQDHRDPGNRRDQG